MGGPWHFQIIDGVLRDASPTGEKPIADADGDIDMDNGEGPVNG